MSSVEQRRFQSVQDIKPKTEPKKESFFAKLGKVLPHTMEETGQRATGVWIPSWFLAVILVPVCGGILWVVITLTTIRTQQDNLQNTMEFRLKGAETDNKLNTRDISDLRIEVESLKSERAQQQRR
jgi:hypothetical protein